MENSFDCRFFPANQTGQSKSPRSFPFSCCDKATWTRLKSCSSPSSGKFPSTHSTMATSWTEVGFVSFASRLWSSLSAPSARVSTGQFILSRAGFGSRVSAIYSEAIDYVWPSKMDSLNVLSMSERKKRKDQSISCSNIDLLIDWLFDRWMAVLIDWLIDWTILWAHCFH